MHLALVRETVGEAADATSRASTREQLKSLPDVVDRLIGTVRKIGAQLRPSVLDDLGLEAAIGCEVKEFVKRTGIKCKFNSAVRNAKLDPKRATEIFRLFQETLTNVVGQTKATEATIQL